MQEKDRPVGRIPGETLEQSRKRTLDEFMYRQAHRIFNELWVKWPGLGGHDSTTPRQRELKAIRAAQVADALEAIEVDGLGFADFQYRH